MRLRVLQWVSLAGLAGLVSAAAALGGCTSSPSRQCGLVGCNSSASIKGYATLSHDDMQTATITGCRNNGCSSGKPLSLPNAPGDRLQIAMNGPVAAQGFITSPDAKGYQIEVVFSVDDQNVKTGDHYDLKIVKADGTEANAYAGDATYVEVAPNGKDCPPFCKSATIDKSQ
jgi:hypothetical protein